MPENNTSEAFVPLLTTRDWNAEWKKLRSVLRRGDDASYWDRRSATYGAKDAPNPYVERFLQLAEIRPGETVFDMGCGTGSLSIPLARRGHRVVAADFSEGMLGRLKEDLAAHRLEGVVAKRMSWDDDWPSHGVLPDSADVALASRSVATLDLRDSLLRLTEVARRRVCVTIATGASPRTDERMLGDLGLSSAHGRDFLYAFNILANEGLRPQASYIESTRDDTFDSRDEAYEAFSRMVLDATALPGSPDREAALERLRAWLDRNLVENEREGRPDKRGLPEKRFKPREQRVVTWAFLSWDR